MLEKQVKEILSDPYGYVVFVGDIIDNGLKNSKTNVYEQTMRPKEQKETADEIYRPLKDRILCGDSWQSLRAIRKGMRHKPTV